MVQGSTTKGLSLSSWAWHLLSIGVCYALRFQWLHITDLYCTSLHVTTCCWSKLSESMQFSRREVSISEAGGVRMVAPQEPSTRSLHTLHTLQMLWLLHSVEDMSVQIDLNLQVWVLICGDLWYRVKCRICRICRICHICHISLILCPSSSGTSLDFCLSIWIRLSYVISGAGSTAANACPVASASALGTFISEPLSRACRTRLTLTKGGSSVGSDGKIWCKWIDISYKITK